MAVPFVVQACSSTQSKRLRKTNLFPAVLTVKIDRLLRAVEVVLPDGVEAMMEGPSVVDQVLHVVGEGTVVSLCAGYVSESLSPDQANDEPSTDGADADEPDDPESDDKPHVTNSHSPQSRHRSRSPPPKPDRTMRDGSVQ